MIKPSKQNNSARTANHREVYGAYKDQLQHENENLNQRVMWNVFSQSSLMGGYAALIGAPEKAKSDLFSTLQDVFIWLLPSTGLLLCLSILPAILAAIFYMEDLKRRYEDGLDADEVNDLPPIYGNPHLRKVSMITPIVLPILLICVWGIVLALQLVALVTK